LLSLNRSMNKDLEQLVESHYTPLPVPNELEEYAADFKAFMSLASKLKQTLNGNEFGSYLAGLEVHSPDRYEVFSNEYPLSWQELIELVKNS